MMDFKMLIVILKRATGFGYRSYPPLSEEIDHQKAEEMVQQSRTLREEVNHIERLLVHGGVPSEGNH